MPQDKNITRIINWLTGMVMGMVIILFPLGYFFISSEYIAGSLETEAEINARIITQIISANPDMWQFEQTRMQEYLLRRPAKGYAEARRVLNTKNELVVESADLLAQPLMSRSTPLFDSGVEVGRIEISRSLKPLIEQTVLLTLFMLPLGAGAFLVFRLLPIRAIRRSEQALRKERDTAQQYLDIAGVILVAIDVDQKVTLINKKGCQILGLSEQELLHTNWFDHYLPERVRATARHEFSQFMTDAQGRTTYFERPILTRNRDERLIAWHMILVKDESGATVGTLSSGEDITERRHLEAQLLHAQKLEAIGQLAGGVAHDFNNILAAIIGHSDLLLMEMPPDDPLRQDVEQILSSSERATRLTRSLLAFSRKQIINPQAIDINEVIQNVEKLLRRLIGSDIDLRIRLAREKVCVMADAGQLEQVLMNLATNARDAMPEGGILTIETGQGEPGHEAPWTQGREKTMAASALLSVSDTGMGMDAKIKERIFDPFFTTKEVGRGTGLGLSTAYGIIKQHHGEITVYSEPGLGTTFKIYLPLIDELSREAAKPVAPVFPRGGVETLLLAEDNAVVRRVTRTMLQRFGYTVIEAADGEEALNKFREYQDRIHLVILDVIMPKMNGKVVHDELRKLRPDIKTLFTSGHTGDVIQEKGLIRQGTAFLSKPASLADLLKKVRGVLDQKP